jgi:hypothetical protein
MILKCWLSVIFLFLVAPTLFAAEERYLCVAEKITGFRYNSVTKNWGPANFRLEDGKHLVTETTTTLDKLEMHTIGNINRECYSIDGFDQHGYAYFECTEHIEFKMYKEPGRYILVYMAGYIDGDNSDNTPFIEIGKCSRVFAFGTETLSAGIP